MEYFRRLLGSLQEALDYFSSFTTYLFGDETHPGAEESGSPRETRHHSSCRDSEAETAYAGDVSPRGHPEAFEAPLTTEVTPPNQDIQVASEAVISDIQATEAIPEHSQLASKCKGQHEDSSQVAADTPKPRPTATVIGSLQQKDLEGPTVTQGLNQWKPEGVTWRGAVQPRALEEVGLDTEGRQCWEPNRLLAGDKELTELVGAGGVEEAHARKCERSLWNEGTAQIPDWALFVGEQQSGLEGPTCTGAFKHGKAEEVAKMAQSQQLEAKKEAAAEAEMGQQGEPEIATTHRVILQSVLERAHSEGDQKGVQGEEEEVWRSCQWKPEGTGTLEEQEWDRKRIREEGNGRQSELEGSEESEGNQQGELEGSVRKRAQIEGEQQEKEMEGVWEREAEMLLGAAGVARVLEEKETRRSQMQEPEGTDRDLQQGVMGNSDSLDICPSDKEQMEGTCEGDPDKLPEAKHFEEEVEETSQPWEPEGTDTGLQQGAMGTTAFLNIWPFDKERMEGACGGEPDKLLEPKHFEEDVQEAETRGSQSQEPEGTDTDLQQGAMGATAFLDIWPFDKERMEGACEGEPDKLLEPKNFEEEVEEAEIRGSQSQDPEGTGTGLQQGAMGATGVLDIWPFDKERMEGACEGEPDKLLEPKNVEEEVEEAETRGSQSQDPEGTGTGLQEGAMGATAFLDIWPFDKERMEEACEGEPDKLLEPKNFEEDVQEAETRGSQSQDPEGTGTGLQQGAMGATAFLDIWPFDKERMEEACEGEPDKLLEPKNFEEDVQEAETRGSQSQDPEGTGTGLQEGAMGATAFLDIWPFDKERMEGACEGEPDKLLDPKHIEEEVEEAETRGSQSQEPEGTDTSLQQGAMGATGVLDTCPFAGEQVEETWEEEPKSLLESKLLEEDMQEAETRGSQSQEPKGTDTGLQQGAMGATAFLDIWPFDKERMEGACEGEPDKLLDPKHFEEDVQEAETRGSQSQEPEETGTGLQQGAMGATAFLDIWPFDKERMEGACEGEPDKLLDPKPFEEVVQEAETRGSQSQDPEGTGTGLQEGAMGATAFLDIWPFDKERMEGACEGEPDKLLDPKHIEEEVEEAETRGSQSQEPEGTDTSLQQGAMGATGVLDTCPFAGEQVEETWEEEPKSLLESKLLEEDMQEAETRGSQSQEPKGTDTGLQQGAMGATAFLNIWPFDKERMEGACEGEPDKLLDPKHFEEDVQEAETRGSQSQEPEETGTGLQQGAMGATGVLDIWPFDKERMEGACEGEPDKLLEPKHIEEEVEEAETRGSQSQEPEGTDTSLQQGAMGATGFLDICPFAGEQVEETWEEEPKSLLEPKLLEEDMQEAETRGSQSQEPKGTDTGLQQGAMGATAFLDIWPFDKERMEGACEGEPDKLLEPKHLEEVKEAETRGIQQWEPEETERGLQQGAIGSSASLSICPFAGEQMEGAWEGEAQNSLEAKHLEEEKKEDKEEAETRGSQPHEPEGTRDLQQGAMGSSASLDICPLVRPETFPDEGLALDTSAQKERVLLRRKSSIRRAPSLKKPKLPTAIQPLEAAVAEDAPPQPPAPSRQNVRPAGFGPMHPNMMAELQMRLRRPQ